MEINVDYTWSDDDYNKNIKWKTEIDMSYESYPSVTKIMKEYYDDEKERLYCYEIPRKKKYCLEHVCWYDYINNDSDDSDDEDETLSYTSSEEITTSSEESITEDMASIIDDEIYKKFSYV